MASIERGGKYILFPIVEQHTFTTAHKQLSSIKKSVSSM